MAVARYVGVFVALLALTLVTVLVASLQLSPGSTIVLGLSIAIVKAALVALFFMHLNSERPMVYWPLALTAFLFVAMFAFILWSEADHIQFQSSMNDDLSIDMIMDEVIMRWASLVHLLVRAVGGLERVSTPTDDLL